MGRKKEWAQAGLPQWLSSKESACNARETGDVGQEDPLEEGMATTSVFLLWESHGQRNLVGYSPWGLKESDTTERLSTHAQARARAQALLGEEAGGRELRLFTWSTGANELCYLRTRKCLPAARMNNYVPQSGSISETER